MSKRSPKSVEEKLEAVQLYLNEGKSVSWLSNTYGVDPKTVDSWVRKYKQDGMDGLIERRTWKKYSQELKEQAVLDYLEGRGSSSQIVEKYKISDQSVLKRWIKRYTSGKDLKATSKGMSRMKQGRKTTFEERVEIVNFTIAHEKDYQAAVEKYSVSYQQVYSWVRKFEKEGSLGLEDRNRLLEMEVGLLKKLQEIERPNLR